MGEGGKDYGKMKGKGSRIMAYLMFISRFLEIDEICLPMAIHFTAKNWCSDPGFFFSKP